MEPIPDGKAGVRRIGGRIQPTKKGSGVNFYWFTIGTPSLVAKLLSFETREMVPRGKAGSGRWRRGVGCSRLALSEADGRRGMLASLLAMIAGTLTVRYREPTREKDMPRIKLSFFVMTMNAYGHIVWPTNFDLHARALLRKLARREVQIICWTTRATQSTRSSPSLCICQESPTWIWGRSRKQHVHGRRRSTTNATVSVQTVFGCA